MMNSIHTNNFGSIQQMTDQYFQKSINNSGQTSEISFDEILRGKCEKQSELKFSKHAMNRLSDRSITLTDAQRGRLEDGVSQAGEKGIRDSLVLVDSLAFIVNVPNKTVVTAMDQEDASEHIFTNIDGAVIA